MIDWFTGEGVVGLSMDMGVGRGRGRGMVRN